jgi:sulfide:quinone oxidoreductase
MIDPSERRVETEAGSLGAEFLLVALGVGPGPEQFLHLHGPAHDLYDARVLPEMRADLAHLDAGTLVVTTPQPMTLPAAGLKLSQFVAGALKDRDIELRTEQRVQAIDVDTRAVSFTDGGQLRYTLLLAVPQAVPPQVVADSPLAGEGG